LDDRRLRVFLAIVDHGSLTAAARSLRLAQPSVSQMLRSIEGELATSLFHRIGRRLVITAAGEAMIGPAREALRSLEQVKAAVAGVSAVEAGSVAIASLSTLATDPLAALIGAFRRLHPQVRVRVHDAETLLSVNALVRTGTCELGLTRLPLRARGLTAVPLGAQQLHFVLPPGSGQDGPLRARDLAEIPLVVAPIGTSTRTLLDRTLAAVGVEPLIAVESAAREATVALVLAGAGAALLPEPIAADAKRRGATIRHPVPPITRQIGIIHRRAPLTPAASSFLVQAVAGASGVSAS
jgi:DNA-binding transcriptional LysR family regulator